MITSASWRGSQSSGYWRSHSGGRLVAMGHEWPLKSRSKQPTTPEFKSEVSASAPSPVATDKHGNGEVLIEAHFFELRDMDGGIVPKPLGKADAVAYAFIDLRSLRGLQPKQADGATITFKLEGQSYKSRQATYKATSYGSALTPGAQRLVEHLHNTKGKSVDEITKISGLTKEQVTSVVHARPSFTTQRLVFFGGGLSVWQSSADMPRQSSAFVAMASLRFARNGLGRLPWSPVECALPTWVPSEGKPPAHALVTASSVSLVCNLRRRKPRSSRSAIRRSKPPAIGSSRIELLVDADSASIELIRAGIRSLEQDGKRQVVTTLFIPPGRLRNKDWAKFIQEPGIKYEAVDRRAVEQMREPTDEAILKAMFKRSSRSGSNGLALLTPDTEFLGPILELQDLEVPVLLLAEEHRYSTISRYTRAGVEVLQLQTSAKPSKVAAVLHPNGTGSVKLDSTYQQPPYDTFIKQERIVRKLMRDLGFRQGDQGFIQQECAKFWCANGHGPLRVWPYMAAVEGVHDFVTERCGKTSWKRQTDHSAYILPVMKAGRGKLNLYGDAWGKAVFEGGGPFTVRSSPDLTAEVFSKLGFLDDGLNADFSEAMYVFVNVTQNKHQLRKLGSLPDPADRVLDVERKLKSAFLSAASPGKWQRLKNNASTMKPLVDAMKKVHVLPPKADFEYSAQDLFEAMKVYAKDVKLPAMKWHQPISLPIRNLDQAQLEICLGIRRPNYKAVAVLKTPLRLEDIRNCDKWQLDKALALDPDPKLEGLPC
eukprot:Skav216451  [mRNA]  locus=scaffold50:666995:683327:- [translate_table: standard]